ncbi:MAG: D-alanine--D-alanine ligase [Gemmatimonadota bacterium]|nr:D-alanine--D-alanine ligase [Gemmatimonadota bacterium]
MSARLRVGVLMGGVSEERDVSLASGVQVARALREAGHDVVAIDSARGVLGPDEERALLDTGVQAAAPGSAELDLLHTGDTRALTHAPEVAGADVLFLTLHGGAGEDGTLQTLLDVAGLPYVGSGRVGCALAMDKDLTKRLLRDGGVPTPDWIRGATPADEVVERLGLPVIVKPASGGSTVGLTLVKDRSDLDAATRLAASSGDQPMYEAYVRGRELTVGILGDEPLPVGEIIPAHEIFDYECKYQPGLAQEIFPADLDPDVAARVQAWALRVHRLLRLRDFSRVDFILAPDGTPWCLEANALPGLTANSLLPKAARAAGIAFPTLCERIARMGVDRARARAPAG